MEAHKLDKLIEKFWQGECTVSEEQQLKDALRSGEIPKEHEPLSQYLGFLEKEKTEKVLDDDFDRELIKHVERSNQHGNQSYFLKIAALIVLMVGLSWFVYERFGQNTTPQVSEFVDTYDNSEEAYREVKKALLMVSSEMNYGMEQTEKLSKFSEVTNDLTTGD